MHETIATFIAVNRIMGYLVSTKVFIKNISNFSETATKYHELVDRSIKVPESEFLILKLFEVH